MQKLLFFCAGVLGALCLAIPLAHANDTTPDEIECRLLGAGLRPNNSEKIRRIIMDIAAVKNIPERFVICSGRDPYIASTRKTKYFDVTIKEIWVISFDDDLFAEAPKEVFRAVMAHELGHLLGDDMCQGTPHLECEHKTDLLGATLVGHCAILRSLEWIIEFKKRHNRRGTESELHILIRMLKEKQVCQQPPSPRGAP